MRTVAWTPTRSSIPFGVVRQIRVDVSLRADGVERLLGGQRTQLSQQVRERRESFALLRSRHPSRIGPLRDHDAPGVFAVPLARRRYAFSRSAASLSLPGIKWP